MEIDIKFLHEKYGLKETIKQALSHRIARKEQLEWWIDREKEIKQWLNVIKQSISINKNYIVFIIGSYGRGKTLSLLKIIDEAKKYEKIYPIYLNFKGEERSKPGLDVIFRIFRSIDFSEIRNKKTGKELKDAIAGIPEDFEEVKNILNRIFFSAGIWNSENEKLKGKINFEIAKLPLYFLGGQLKPNVSQLRELGVIRKIENIDIAKEYLVGILYFMRNLGLKVLLLAIDEFESLFSLVSKSQQSIYVALLRSLYDFPPKPNIKAESIANMAFFVAVSESGWGSLKEMEKMELSTGGPTVPLLERVDLATSLSVFDRNQSRTLIEKRLSYSRIKGKFEDKPLIPFTEDFVDFIFQKTGGEPRYIIVRCGQVLNVGLDEEVLLLNKEFAQRVLEERNP